MIKPKTPFALADAYKLSHEAQYPSGTTLVYSNLTPRRSLRPGIEKVVFFGLQAFLMRLNEVFAERFFGIPEEEAVGEFERFYHGFFGSEPTTFGPRVRELHQLGYLPLKVKALPEGSLVKHGIPVLTIENTHPRFFWLTNWLETWMSSELWGPCTSATTAHEYRKLFVDAAAVSSTDEWFVDFQGHDFCPRGMWGMDAAAMSGAGHLLSFKGTDACMAIEWIDKYYPGSKDLVGTSVPATEHSVMCAGGQDDEAETLQRLLTEVYPAGIVSVVSDTWDFWKVVTEYLPSLREVIMSRNGKLVIRPDSSPKTPNEIVNGDPEAEEGSPERKGLLECLWETFGGTINEKGFRVLDSHIGAIYGDSITLPLAKTILSGMVEHGFASTNIVLGIGSFTYTYVSRDTHGFAIKATAVAGADGVIRGISKDPKTDRAGKKSARGLLAVVKEAGEYRLIQDVHQNESIEGDCLEIAYLDGELKRFKSFQEVREVLVGEW